MRMSRAMASSVPGAVTPMLRRSAVRPYPVAGPGRADGRGGGIGLDGERVGVAAAALVAVALPFVQLRGGGERARRDAGEGADQQELSVGGERGGRGPDCDRVAVGLAHEED